MFQPMDSVCRTKTLSPPPEEKPSPPRQTMLRRFITTRQGSANSREVTFVGESTVSIFRSATNHRVGEALIMRKTCKQSLNSFLLILQTNPGSATAWEFMRLSDWDFVGHRTRASARSPSSRN